MCGIEKDVSNFYKRNTKLGYRLDCKECISKRSLEYYSLNEKKVKERKKKYHLLNKEKLNKISKEYRLANIEKMRITQKRYYENNKERIRARERIKRKLYYRTNRERELIQSREYRKTERGKAIQTNKNHKRRLQIVETDITSEWLKNFYGEFELCPICSQKLSSNGKLFNGKQLDHIVPLNIGGEHKKYNVRIICRRCNQVRPRDGSDIEQIRLAI